MSRVKDLISAVGVAPENVLRCSPSLRTQQAQQENTSQTTSPFLGIIFSFQQLLYDMACCLILRLSLIAVGEQFSGLLPLLSRFELLLVYILRIWEQALILVDSKMG